MKKFLGVACAALLVAGCSDPKTAQRVLAQNGFTDIRTTGYSAFSCGQGDTYATGFEAKAVNGNFVRGTVCSAWMKGATIRFD